MTSLNVAEAKKRFSDLLGRVAYGGETILITRRGKPMAKLVPLVERDEEPASFAGDRSRRGLGRVPGLLRRYAPASPVSVEDMRQAIVEEAAAGHRRATTGGK
jgi:prevent-host-death family protein